MTPQTAGAWVMIVLGAVVVLAAVIQLFRSEPKAILVLQTFIFGILLCGVGSNGMPFLDPFGRFLKAILQSPSDQTYEQAVNAVASGKVDAPHAQALLAYMEARPTPRFRELLEGGAARAKNPSARAVLNETLVDFGRREATATRLAEALSAAHQLTPEGVGTLDRSSQIFVAHQLIANPQLAHQLNVNPQTFGHLSVLGPSLHPHSQPN